MKKKFFFVFLALANLLFIYSQELNINLFFNSKEIERVKKGEIITRMYLKNNAVNENTDKSINIVRTKYANEDCSVYEMITDEKAFIPYKIDDPKKKLNFYNTLLAYSKLKGAVYFSRRVQRVKSLIEDSYRIDSPDKDKKANDITAEKIEQKAVYFLIQKDNIFGKMTYKNELYNDNDNFILVNTALQPFSKMMFTICNKEENKFITYFIYDKEAGGYFYYAYNVMRIRSDTMLKTGSHLTLYPTTFSNRLRAATVQFAKLLGLNWDSKLNPWDEDMLEAGKYKNY